MTVSLRKWIRWFWEYKNMKKIVICKCKRKLKYGMICLKCGIGNGVKLGKFKIDKKYYE